METSPPMSRSNYFLPPRFTQSHISSSWLWVESFASSSGIKETWSDLSAFKPISSHSAWLLLTWRTWRTSQAAPWATGSSPRASQPASSYHLHLGQALSSSQVRSTAFVHGKSFLSSDLCSFALLRVWVCHELPKQIVLCLGNFCCLCGIWGDSKRVWWYWDLVLGETPALGFLRSSRLLVGSDGTACREKWTVHQTHNCIRGLSLKSLLESAYPLSVCPSVAFGLIGIEQKSRPERSHRTSSNSKSWLHCSPKLELQVNNFTW